MSKKPKKGTFLAEGTFPSLVAALERVKAWADESNAGGRMRGTLAAFVAVQDPSAVVAKLATRAYWIGLGVAKDGVLAELQREDADDDLRVMILGGDDSRSTLLEQALAEAKASETAGEKL